MSAALDTGDYEVLFLALDLLDRHTSDELAKARKAGNNAKQAAMINMRSRLVVLRGRLRAGAPEQNNARPAVEQSDSFVGVRGPQSIEADADIALVLGEVHKKLEHARERIALGLVGMSALDKWDHAIINLVLVMLDHRAAVELIDARSQLDNKKEMAVLAMSRQIARVRSILQVVSS